MFYYNNMFFPWFVTWIQISSVCFGSFCWHWMYFEQLFWKDAVIGDVGSNRYWRWIWEAVSSLFFRQRWKLSYRWFSDEVYLTVLAESWRSTVTQSHSHERAVNNRAAIDTISSETQHTCGSCNVTTSSMWRVQNYELCVGIWIQYIVLKDIRHV